MASPSTSISRVEFSTGFHEFDLAAGQAGFIGPSVLRPHAVSQKSGSIGQVPVEQLLQERETKRAPRSGYSRGNFTFGTIDFNCVEHGAEEILDDAELAAYADLLDQEAVAAARARDAVLRDFEREVAAAIYDPSVWTGGLTTGVTDEWDDAENATPIDDVHAAKQTVHDRCGFWPNAMILNQKQFNALQVADQILDRVAYGTSGEPSVVTASTLAQVFGLDRILIGSGTYNSAAEGQSLSVEPIWSDEYAMVCRVATGNDVSEPALGRSFLWGGDGPTGFDGETIGIELTEYREESVRGSIIRARCNWDLVVTLSNAGQLLGNIIT